jgi:hypothetical protein
MPLSAEFSVEGDDSVIAHEVAYAQTVDLELLSADGARSIAWSIAGTSHSSMASPTITPAGSPTGATASFAMPADPADGEGRSVVVKCLLTDNSGATAVAYRVVGVPNNSSIVPVAVGEENYRSATHGWTETFNAALASANTPTFTAAHGTTFLYGTTNAAGTASLVRWGVGATDRLTIGDATNVATSHFTALTSQSWNIGATEEMTLAASALTLATNDLVITAGKIKMGAAPAADAGGINVSSGWELFARDSGNTADYRIFTWAADESFQIGSSSLLVALTYHVASGGSHSFNVNGAEELAISGSAVTLPTNNLTLTAGALIMGATVAGSGDMRIKHDWGAFGRRNDNGADYALIRYGAATNTLTLGETTLPGAQLNAVSVVLQAAGTTRVQVDGTGIGVFGHATAAQAADFSALTDNSAGSADNTIQAMASPTDSPASADALRDDISANLMPAIRNNFADLAAKVNAIRTVLRAHGWMA